VTRFFQNPEAFFAAVPRPKTLCFTNGCFDLIHPGHVQYLADAKALGDFLVVGLNSDASVARLKGPGRPLQDEAARAAILLGLRSVDAVVRFDEDTPLELIRALRPDVLVKGGDYTAETTAGAAEVLSAGNKVIVNIAEHALYLPGSYTFTKESPQLRQNLATLLRKSELKGKDVYIGNTTEVVPAPSRGRKKAPPKDARTLAAERSAVLIRDFEKNGVDQDALIITAYSSKQAGIGFKLKSRKTVIIIENPPVGPAVASKQEPVKEAQPKPTQATKPSATSAASPQSSPNAIPIKPAQPKTN